MRLRHITVLSTVVACASGIFVGTASGTEAFLLPVCSNAGNFTIVNNEIILTQPVGRVFMELYLKGWGGVVFSLTNWFWPAISREASSNFWITRKR